MMTYGQLLVLMIFVAILLSMLFDKPRKKPKQFRQADLTLKQVDATARGAVSDCRNDDGEEENYDYLKSLKVAPYPGQPKPPETDIFGDPIPGWVKDYFERLENAEHFGGGPSQGPNSYGDLPGGEARNPPYNDPPDWGRPGPVHPAPIPDDGWIDEALERAKASK